MKSKNKIIIFFCAILIQFWISSCSDEKKYFVGPKIENASQLYGKYCDESCSMYINLNGIDHLSNISPLSEKDSAYALQDKWDGYAYLVKGGGSLLGDNSFLGFWKIKTPLPAINGIIQSHKYPLDSKNKLFNGVEIYIKWVPDSRGLDSYIDGTYQLRYSPNGLDWYDETRDKKETRLMICLPEGSVKFERKKIFQK